MHKEKVTLTLDSAPLTDLRRMVGARGLSAAVDSALAAHVAHLRHLEAVDEWLDELEAEDGPIPPEVDQWAKGVVGRWLASESERIPPESTPDAAPGQ